MTHPFEELPTTPLGDELVDTAFSRAARAGRAKGGIDAQQSMLQTAANVVGDNLENVVTGWPDFDAIHPFYRELADALVGVDALRQHLSEVGWASEKAGDIRREYEPRLHAGDVETARKLRKQAFARLADVVDEVSGDLEAVMDAHQELRDLPDIQPEEPTIVVAGYPNVGKSSFVNAVTRASNEEAAYPFTTTRIHVGHLTRDHIRYQLIDTPGLLDRPAAERNEVESQAVSALEHAADAVLVVLDPTGEAGYPLAVQQALRDDVTEQFDVPVLSVYNKADRFGSTEHDAVQTDDGIGSDAEGVPLTMSVREGAGLESVLAAAIEAIGYEPELPIE